MFIKKPGHICFFGYRSPMRSYYLSYYLIKQSNFFKKFSCKIA